MTVKLGTNERGGRSVEAIPRFIGAYGTRQSPCIHDSHSSGEHLSPGKGAPDEAETMEKLQKVNDRVDVFDNGGVPEQRELGDAACAKLRY